MSGFARPATIAAIAPASRGALRMGDILDVQPPYALPSGTADRPPTLSANRAH